jgi:hypothetical protein
MLAVAESVGLKRIWATRVARWLILALALMAAIVAIAVLGSLQATAGPYGQFIVKNWTSELIAGSRAGQSFVTDQAGLYRIDVYLGNFQRANHGPLRLHVTAVPFEGPDLASDAADAAQLHGDDYVSFEFAPLREPAGQTLSFWLEAPQARPGNALAAMGTNSDAYPGGRAVFDHLADTRGVQDLAFRLYYRPAAGSAAATLLQRLSADRPSIFGAPQLYVVLLAGYLLGVVVLFGLVVARLRL